MNSKPSLTGLNQFHERAAAALAPFFLDAAQGDQAKAMDAARSMIDSYQPATPAEIQLSAQIAASQFAALACLRTAAAARGLPIEDVLKLQKAALAMDKITQASTKLLEQRQKERQGRRAPLDQAPWDSASFDKAISKALDSQRYADSRMPAPAAKPAPLPQLGKPKLTVISGEPMTEAVLSRLATKAERRPPGARRH